MKRRLEIALFVAVTLGSVALAQGPSNGPAIRDDAKMFSPETTRRAEQVLREVATSGRLQVLIETRETFGNQAPRDVAIENARRANLRGLSIAISRREHKLDIEPSESARRVFSKGELELIKVALSQSFRKNQFDEGLTDAVAEIRRAAMKVGVRDHAKVFSASALKEADEVLETVRRKNQWGVIIETVDSIGERPIRNVAVENARDTQVHGLYVLIAKKEHKIFALPSESTAGAKSRETATALVSTLTDAFKKGSFDKGLHDAVETIRREAERAAASSAPPKPASPTLGLMTQSAEKGASNRPPTIELGDDKQVGTVEKTLSQGPETQAANKSMTNPPSSIELGDDEKSGPVEKTLAAPSPTTDPGAVKPESTTLMMILLGGGVLVFVLWMVFRGSRNAQNPPIQPQPFQTQPQFPAGGGGPAQQTGPRPGYPQTPRPATPPPGYPGQAGSAPGYGYVPPPPGYGPAGYGVPPQQGGGVGGFVTGALGGAAGAIAGNLLYDQFGRPHGSQGSSHAQGGEFVPQGSHPSDPNANFGSGPPAESYTPNSGVEADWGAADPASSTPETDQGGVGGDWGTPEPVAENSADWSGGSEEPADAGGDWSGGSEEPADAGGDWSGGSEEPADAGGDWSGGSEAEVPDPAVNDDWSGGGEDQDGGDTDGAEEQGGSW